MLHNGPSYILVTVALVQQQVVFFGALTPIFHFDSESNDADKPSVLFNRLVTGCNFAGISGNEEIVAAALVLCGSYTIVMFMNNMFSLIEHLYAGKAHQVNSWVLLILVHGKTKLFLGATASALDLKAPSFTKVEA